MKTPLLTAIDQCSSTVVDKASIELGFRLLSLVNKQAILEEFISRTHKHWELIATSSDVAVIVNTVLSGFKELGQERIDEIVRIVNTKEVSVEVQNRLLDLGKKMVKVSLSYLNEDGTVAGLPTGSVDIPQMAKLYKIEFFLR